MFTEHAIIFSAPMVRAILSGAKTVTRRIVRPQPPHGCAYMMNGSGNAALCLDEQSALHGITAATRFVPPTPRSADHRLPCPHGVPGDMLWVREAWSAWFLHEGAERDWHDTPKAQRTRERMTRLVYRASDPNGASRWVTPLFMPRWASRIARPITELRIERLHAITEDDAIREGVDAVSVAEVPRNGTLSRYEDFAQLWQKINGKRASWHSNPFVWRIAFPPTETS